MTTARRCLAGLLASLLILGIVVGLPAALLAVGANPFSAGLPTFETIKAAFTTPDDGTLALGAIKVVAWASWAFLTGSILLEVLARIRGVRVPPLPGLALPQSTAHGLVGLAAMLFIAVPLANTAAAATASATPAAPTVVASQTHRPSHPNQAAGQPAGPTAKTTAPAAGHNVQAAAPQRTVEHQVKRGETLWSIAQNTLGDGRRYKEIYALNRDVLVKGPSFLAAGWMLRIPAPAPPPASSTQNSPATDETLTVQKGDTLSEIALEELGDASRYPEIFEASKSIEQPDHRHLTDPNRIYTGWKLTVPSAAGHAVPSSSTPALSAAAQAPAAPAPASPAPAHTAPLTALPAPAPSQSTPEPAPSTPAPSHVASAQGSPGASVPGVDARAEHLQEDSAWMVRTGYGVGAVLAAGVLALIATRRRNQQRRRRPGQRLPLPAGPAAQVEQDLRATADQLSVDTVDRALRSLAQTCTANQAPLPVVRAGRLTSSQFDLYLAEPAQLPEPWIGTADATVWTLGVEDTGDLEHLDLARVPAPYPSLVTIGHDEEDGHVFLDLEHLGALGVAGPTLATKEILAALAVELATSIWADDLQVTLVGAFPELEDTLRTGRIRYLPTVGRALEDLLHRADADRAAMTAEGVDDLHAARASGVTPDAWPPEIVLLAGEITDRQRNQLEQLVDSLPRVALAAVTTGGTAVGEWALNLDAGDRPDLAVLNPIGLQLQPQRLPAQQYGHLLEIASLAEVDELDGDAAPEPSLADVEAITPVDDVTILPPAPADLATTLPEVTLAQLEQSETVPASAQEDTDVSSSTAAATDTGPTASDPTPDPTPDPTLDDAVVEDTADVAAVASASEQSPGHPEGEPDLMLPLRVPKITVLGPVDLLSASGPVEPSKRARLLEFAAYLALHPGATHTAIDDAIWPDRKTEDNLNTRNPATSKLRRWIGTDLDGNEYLPRHQAGEGYALLPSVTTDAGEWDQLLVRAPLDAPTANLERALELVHGIPFEGTHRKRYAWAEPIKQRLISEIVDASYELGRRRLMEGRWRAAEQALVVGLRIEPAQENLWRLRILAAHESRNRSAETEAIERLLTITEELECELEPETEQLLAALKQPGTGFDQLMANAL